MSCSQFTIIALLWGACLLCGCRSLPWRRPTDSRTIASRELCRVGLDALHQGRIGEARTRFFDALKKSPKDVDARHHLALALWKDGEHAQAIEELELAIRGSGGEPMWIVELGEMKLVEGDLDHALQAADLAIAADSGLSKAWALRADVLKAQNKLDDALRDFHRAAATEPSTHVLLQIADVYRLQGRPRRALTTLYRVEEMTLDQQSRPPRLDYLQAIALQALGRHEDAVEKFRLAQSVEGDAPELALLLARSLWESGDADGARQTMQRLVSENPHDVRVADFARQINASSARVANASHEAVDAL